MTRSEWEAAQVREHRKALALATLGWLAAGFIIGLTALGAWTLIDAMAQAVCA